MSARRTAPRPPGAASRDRREARRRAVRRRRLMAYAVPAALLVAVVGVGVVVTGRTGGQPAGVGEVRVDGPPRTEPLRPGEVVPDFSAPGLDGEAVVWSEHRGGPVLLAVWAPWCPHCQEELPILGRVAAEFPDVRVVTVVTAVGLRPGPDPREFLRDHGLSFPTAVDDGAGTLAGALGIQGFPTVYAVGPDGAVRAAAVGEIGETGLRALLRDLAQAS